MKTTPFPELALYAITSKPKLVIFCLESYISEHQSKIQAVFNAVEANIYPPGLSKKLKVSDIQFCLDEAKKRQSLKTLVEEMCKNVNPYAQATNDFARIHRLEKDKLAAQHSSFENLSKKLKDLKVQKVTVTNHFQNLKEFKMSLLFEMISGCLLISPKTINECNEDILDDILESPLHPKKIGIYSNMLILALAKKTLKPSDVMLIADNKLAIANAKDLGITSCFLVDKIETANIDTKQFKKAI